MKFSVTFLLLLAPLAFVVEAAEEGKVYAKLLFDAGYVISKGDEARIIEHVYQTSADDADEDPDVLAFSSQDDYANQHQSWDHNMMVYGKLNETTSFVIESRTNEGHDLGDCVKQSDERLRHMIAQCGPGTRLRALTTEERAEMQQYKLEQQESKKPFEVVYSDSYGMKSVIKSVGMDSMHFEDAIQSYAYRVLSVAARFNRNESYHEMFVMVKPEGRSLVIESLPADSKEACRKIGLEDLFLAHCRGRIQIRSA